MELNYDTDMKFRLLRSSSFPAHFKPKPSLVTIGNFDGVHIGHQKMIEDLYNIATNTGLIATLMTFEPLPREVFNPGENPGRITPFSEKARLLRRYGIKQLYVQEFSPPFARLSPADFVQHILIERLGARHLYVGADFRFGHKRSGDVTYLQENADKFRLKITVMPDFTHEIEAEHQRVSSTLVRTHLALGDMQYVAALLGRPWQVRSSFYEDDQCVLNAPITRYAPVKNAAYWVKIYWQSGAEEKNAILPVICRDNLVKVRPLGQLPDLPEGPVRIDFLEKVQDLNLS